jgi:outer membrane protein insertion porin family
MKKEGSASNSGSGNGAKIKQTVLALLLVGGYLCLSVSLFPYPASPGSLEEYTIDNIYFRFPHRVEEARVSSYTPLLHLKSGAAFNYQMIRKSMDNLYKIGSFDNIEVTVGKNPDNKIDIYFIITPKYLVQAVKTVIKNTAADIDQPPGFKKKELQNAIFSLRKDTYFESEKLNLAVKEIKTFLHSRGYFNPEVTYKLQKNKRYFTVTVKLSINIHGQAEINDIRLTGSPPGLGARLRRYFSSDTIPHTYAPHQFKEKIEKAKKILKQQGYLFPEITVKEEFLGSSPVGVKVNLAVRVEPGYRYVFKFKGMKKKIDLIASVWEKKVFEKWAEKESKARILYYLKNKGYLDANVQSNITEKPGVKTITFMVDRGKKYALGKIYFQGNVSVPEKELYRIIQTDDLLFEKFFHLRLNPLLVDQEVLRIYYYFQGFPSAQVFPRLDFRGRKADIHFIIAEGKKFTVESILFEGNHSFSSRELQALMRTRANGPFAQQKLNEDLEKIKSFYLSSGFDNAAVTADVSPGTEKAILIHIKEGTAYRMGDLVIIGASPAQRRLIETLFPLEPNSPFDRTRIEAFQNEIESSAIFTEFKIARIEKESRVLNVLVNVRPDSGKYYGFGIGWEERKDFHVTVEYQKRNILSSYSTISLMFQYGINEKRGLLSYDTPFFFRKRLNSSFKIWADTEIYPSYEFNRYGAGETLIKKLSPDTYLTASLSWYRTELTKLEIKPHGVDQLRDPFDTTALTFSYVREKRDDSFNPTQGSFFSSNLKLGIPIFENYSFIKLSWRYQHNFKILKNGTFAASLRNGLAYGDLSITERFFAGGFNTFRGTGRDRLGPLDPETGKPMGGSGLVLMNFETTFPIIILPVSDLYYCLFTDVGNVFEKPGDFSFKYLETAVGFSLKYKTRMGPLRFDVAWDLKTGKPQFHIGIGNVF